MERLTEKGVCGNWSLKGLPWKDLYEGTPITRETYEILYGALCKLLDYEETGLTPEEIEKLNDFEKSQVGKMLKRLNKEQRKHRWIPVERKEPPFGQRLQATILHHEWIADYESSQVPEEEKTRHPAYIEVCEIFPVGAMWCYICTEDEYRPDIAYISPVKDLSAPVAEIIAWRPLPEPYEGA